MENVNKSSTNEVKKQMKTLKNGNPINVSTQFGQPNGNPRHNGGWKKENTARYKLERMLELTEEELMTLSKNKEASLFERRIARSLLKENEWKTTEAMINQVYGLPKQSVETIDLTPPKPLSPRKQKDANNS